MVQEREWERGIRLPVTWCLWWWWGVRSLLGDSKGTGSPLWPSDPQTACPPSWPGWRGGSCGTLPTRWSSCDGEQAHLTSDAHLIVNPQLFMMVFTHSSHSFYFVLLKGHKTKRTASAGDYGVCSFRFENAHWTYKNTPFCRYQPLRPSQMSAVIPLTLFKRFCQAQRQRHCEVVQMSI